MINKVKRFVELCGRGRLNSAVYKICNSLGRGRVLSSLPFSLMIEPTNICNLKCPTCPTGSGKMNRPGRFMTFLEFKRIIDQVVSHVDQINLWNYGEPFLNKDILKIIKYATSKRINVITSTNGEFLNSKKFCLEIVKSGLQHLIICLDGMDQETINKIRKGANFDNIINGFKLISEAKKELNSKHPKVELQFIVTKHNEHQKEAMQQLAK